MLAIRLTRTGKVHAPHYRIVVQEKRSKLNGKAVEIIGHYHPAQAEKLLVVNKERAEYWISKGAQPSDTVTNLLVKEGILDKSRKVHNFFTPTKKEEVAATPVEPEAEAAEAEEAEVAEVATEAVAEETIEETPEVKTEEVVAEEPATEELTEKKEEVAPKEAKKASKDEE